MDKITRRQSTKVMVGNVQIGGNADINVQSMTNTFTKDVKATVYQILQLEEAGCEIIRVAVADDEDANAIKEIKKQIHIPLVADIHFDYRLALKSIENGIDKLRINPGNIGGRDRVKKVVEKAKERNIPIRIGVNAGSIHKDILKKYGGPSSEGMVESALEHVKILEDLDYDQIVISMKGTDIKMTIEAYKSMARKVPYPLHLGITHAGTFFEGSIRSAIGVGSLLAEGIGDTIRISLTDDPLEEVRVAREILKSLNLRNFGINYITCPTCGRTRIRLIDLSKKIQEGLKNVNKPITVAIMGCAVNGPGEARQADIGIAGGKGEALLFKKGQIIGKVKEEDLVKTLLEEIEKLP
ncbi:MAG TPA: flavodoxin-dependent (E)-4-hydroxy-3-methylbut-2-enyl-diphosphate synthase [Sedimentibacter sp.]|jgi:(E)-4-hydroxy-3-methylbut-2-enyl-diphosphate synthase|nr:flavodoxin-dependent (E)-4-hydroxy-3-methylbut-2-enyl-diphosphate synthase [Sedimentibacter sp.]HHZ00441.1 flavodoxin-dependent (E)-4-hydroxy-3-methylbut-2-enyl-diphosphate synthase [Tissierellia bacterium]HOK48575.1 flavodoxin-dependent (E)-4-hydroxy-3-methylbut-2-enyl-diphosphate synthase [Sedimentibacter sp.]HOW24007.1 flavodoxin-dependent (E)-4-hydroxy-3-methylbut-2-enyl-diphosphate synthase [Sedimentibacter sp.]HRC80180.1 flavodoxin-dependent (E)-4-hydroxy-3-methylbut-2-enyl-diphosphate